MKTNPSLSRTFASLALAFALLLGACSSATPTPEPTVDVNAIYTQAAATIAAELTQTEQAKPTATPIPPTETPEPTATLQPIDFSPPTEAPTIAAVATQAGFPTPTTDASAAFGCHNATLLADVTVPYGANYKPGDKFTKTWRIRNTGSCDWNRGFLLTFIGGDSFGAANKTIDQKIPAGGIMEISIAMTAPNLPGTNSSYWQLATDTGKPFGSLLGVTITLPAAAQTTTTPTGCLNAALVSQSPASGAEIKQGDDFTATWVLQNTGSCEWNSDFKITFVGGNVLGSDSTKLRKGRINPGANVEISLQMTAPSGVGQVVSSWQLASDEGVLFGPVYTIIITLK
jgi:hypothetical protein